MGRSALWTGIVGAAFVAAPFLVSPAAAQSHKPAAKGDAVHTDAMRGFSIPLPSPRWTAQTDTAAAGSASVALRFQDPKRFATLYVTVGALAPDAPERRDLKPALEKLERSFGEGVELPRRRARRQIAFRPAKARAWELVMTGKGPGGERVYRRHLLFVTDDRLWMIEVVASHGAEKPLQSDIARALDGLRVLAPKVERRHTDPVRSFSIERPGAHWRFVLGGDGLGSADCGVVKLQPRVYAAVFVSVVRKTDAPVLDELVLEFRTRSRAMLADAKVDRTTARPGPLAAGPMHRVTVDGPNEDGVRVRREARIFIAKANGHAYIVETVAAGADIDAAAEELTAIAESLVPAPAPAQAARDE